MSFKRLMFFVFIGAMLLASGNAGAQADLAPTPRKMPRTPVHRENIATKPAVPVSRDQTGALTILDNERLRIGDVEMRLFGVVPPLLSASFGPQARAVLDNLTATGSVNCVIRDRDRDGRYMATCRNAAGADLALELLRRGLAVAARGTLRSTDLAGAYAAAEQAAQGQRLGLWSVKAPPAASQEAIREAAAVASAKAAPPPPLEEKTREEEPKTEPKPETAAETKAEPDPVIVSITTSSSEVDKPVPVTPKIEEMLPYLTPLAAQRQPAAQAVAELGFFERYQLLVTGLLMLFTALGVIAAVFFQRWHDKQEELRSIAAALRGELMAARAVCQARLNALRSESDKGFGWPRIRTLVFQAYVGRLGMLGSVLARQIASIYGQASDYSMYYGVNNPDAKNEPFSKRKALQTLVNHIEEVLPRLADFEAAPLNPMRPMIASAAKDVAALPAPAAKLEKPDPCKEEPIVPAVDDAKTQPEAKEDISAEVVKTPPVEATKASKAAEAIAAIADDVASATVEADPPEPSTVAKPESAIKAAPLWDSIRKFATERLDKAAGSSKKTSSKKPSSAEAGDTMEYNIPDYTLLSEEEEIEALSYVSELDDIADLALPKKKKRRKVG